MPEFLNIAAYKFVDLDQVEALKADLLPLCKSLELKGTILLSREGINLFLAGLRSNVEKFLSVLRAIPELTDLEVKESISDHQPFSRMLVRLKKEIISMGVQEIQPRRKTSPKISPKQLKAWLDEGREVALLDVRNDYEVELGTFENAIRIGVDSFRDFPAATERLPDEYRQKPIVMFCTGGIRCEKAGPLMEAKGFQEIYQLDGGILKYFEECGGEHYRGDCFVFDKRVAVDPDLNETTAELCYGCQAVLSIEDQQSPNYDPPNTCPHCFSPPPATLDERLAERKTRLIVATTPLPGSKPYDNVRPMNVTSKFDNRTVLEFLLSRHVQLKKDFWMQACADGRVRYKDQLLAASDIVRSGWRIQHVVPETIEPFVSNDIEFLFEDEGLIAVSKPAPLPMHPCGRFNKNTLQNFLRLAYPHEQVRILHRLDAETTGLLLLARTRATAALLHQQFANGEIEKTYLAKVIGHPVADQFECTAPISEKPTQAGGIRQVDLTGLPSLTTFEVTRRDAAGTSLLKCFPKTGRTNQIRIHLAELGFPILGDNSYGPMQAEYPKSNANNSASPNSARLHLHAAELKFEYPIGKPLRIAAPTPNWWLS